VLVFTDPDRATSYAGFMLTEGYDVAVISASDEKIQEHAFEGDPEGLCIVDPQTWHPPGLPVKVSKLAEWVETSELEE
jgi:hypothetical protein